MVQKQRQNQQMGWNFIYRNVQEVSFSVVQTSYKETKSVNIRSVALCSCITRFGLLFGSYLR